MQLELLVHHTPANRRSEWCILTATMHRNLEKHHLWYHFLICFSDTFYVGLGAWLTFSDFQFVIRRYIFFDKGSTSSVNATKFSGLTASCRHFLA